MSWTVHVTRINNRQEAAQAFQRSYHAVTGDEIDLDTALDNLMQALEANWPILGLQFDTYDQAAQTQALLEEGGVQSALVGPEQHGHWRAAIDDVVGMAIGDQLRVIGEPVGFLADTDYQLMEFERRDDKPVRYVLAPLHKRTGEPRSTNLVRVIGEWVARAIYDGFATVLQVDRGPLEGEGEPPEVEAELVEPETDDAPGTAVATVTTPAFEEFFGDEAEAALVQELGRLADADDVAGALNLLATVEDEDLLEAAGARAAGDGVPLPFIDLIGNRLRELRKARAEEAAAVEVLEARTQHLECVLTDEERNRMAREVTDLTLEIEELEQKRAQVAKRLKAEADLKQAELRDLRTSVQAGFVFRDVVVEHRWKPGAPYVEVVRTDTGAVMKKRPPTDEERQRRMNFGTAAR